MQTITIINQSYPTYECEFEDYRDAVLWKEICNKRGLRCATHAPNRAVILDTTDTNTIREITNEFYAELKKQK